MRVVELFELQSEEGPCLNSFRSGQHVTSGDLTRDNPWPRLSAVAVAVGFKAADAIPMRLRGQVIGALNLFRSELDSMTDDDAMITRALADVATIAILQHRVTVEAQTVREQLNQALDGRLVLEQAKGMVAEGLQATWPKRWPASASTPARTT